MALPDSFRERSEQAFVESKGGLTAQRVVSEEPALTTAVDAVDSSTTYVGEAPVGSQESAAVWSIKKISTSGTVTRITWADGNTSFDNVWDDRTTITYS